MNNMISLYQINSLYNYLLPNKINILKLVLLKIILFMINIL